jgi:hypothetical protein
MAVLLLLLLLLCMFSSIRNTAVSYFYGLENPGLVASRTKFCKPPRQSCLNPIKLGLSKEIHDEWNSWLCASQLMY